MGYLQDFITFGSGTECPEPFLTWSGLSLLGAVLGRRVWYQHGDHFTIYPNLYVCMVGTAGSGKSTAMSFAETIFIEDYPNYLISDSIQSREDMLKKMGSDACKQYWTDIEGNFSGAVPGTIHEFRPFYCIVDELSNFVSVDKDKMIGTLVGIYSRNSYGTGFKGDANPNQRFKNPCVSMLSCTVPDWIMNSLRMDLFTGGLGRRLIIVHCRKEKVVPFPNMTQAARDALVRVREHLKEAEAFYGSFHLDEKATAWWNSWYMDKKRFNREDPILMQFHETKHVQLLKVALLLAMDERPFKRIIEARHLQAALIMLNALEEDIVKLTSGIGRNELAGIGSQVMDFIERVGQGCASLVSIKKFYWRYLNTPEFKDVMQHYLDTKQLFQVCAGQMIPLFMESRGLTEPIYYLSPEKFEEYKKTKTIPSK